MIPNVYLVPQSSVGSLYIMPKPSSEYLAEDVLYYADLGINLVVSLLEVVEVTELRLDLESSILTKASIDFIQFPVLDRGLPSKRAFKELVTELVRQLEFGKSIAVHCRAGIGRSSVLASCILIEQGVQAQAAIAAVAKARRLPIPDTEEQLSFIQRYQAD